MPKKASDERRRFWHDVVERQKTSGLNIAQFCAQAGVAQNSFYVWKRRLRTIDSTSERSAQRPSTASPQRTRRRKKSAVKSRSLVPVRLVTDVDRWPITAGVIEIAWPEGIVLRIPAGCNSDTLRDVFGLLTTTLNGAAPSC